MHFVFYNFYIPHLLLHPITTADQHIQAARYYFSNPYSFCTTIFWAYQLHWRHTMPPRAVKRRNIHSSRSFEHVMGAKGDGLTNLPPSVDRNYETVDWTQDTMDPSTKGVSDDTLTGLQSTRVITRVDWSPVPIPPHPQCALRSLGQFLQSVTRAKRQSILVQS